MSAMFTQEELAIYAAYVAAYNANRNYLDGKKIGLTEINHGTGKTITASQLHNADDCFKFIYQGLNRTEEEVQEIMNRALIKQVKTIWHSFFDDDVERDFFELQTTNPTKLEVSNNPHNVFACIESDGIGDKPTTVYADRHRIMIKWEKDKLLLHRPINFGPAVVHCAQENRNITINHCLNGKRVKGHKDWKTRCAAHNPWLNLWFTKPKTK